MFLSHRAMVLLLVLIISTMMFCEKTAGEVYEVGDAAGWTTIGHVDYKAWAASKTFKVGDTIMFKYNKEFHNVVRVSHQNYNACNATGAIATFNSGNDSFVIRRPETHIYFICGIPGHCDAGQKLDIRLSNATGAAPTPGPAPLVNPGLPPPYPTGSSPSSAPSPSSVEHEKSDSAVYAGSMWLCIIVIVHAAYYLSSPFVF